ncbi:hypothetical protein [Mucilaginibacter arboris]|uniref:PsbP C-terminal domain-containing protein n=1 Tax=Mucilaginibacter arboris TaxID=2682090 RepID=A0A7K1SY19_9SPHI|nr:hypothetical protein [Mucilaginibacter arboris]MVN22147.1 hypothetical protein [Mucilaginibacter arboris]
MTTFRFLGLLLFLFFAGKNSIAQTLKTYKDATNHFEISIPANWSVTKSNPRLKFIAIRPQTEEYTSVPENINLNFIEAPDVNLDAAYAMSIESNSALDGFIAVTKKGTAADGRYKWYVNTHKDLQNNLTLQTIVFVYYYKQKAILLTCTALPESFEKYNPVFFKIANSLKLQ